MEAPSTEATGLAQFQHQVVRDLYWVLSSPQLLHGTDLGVPLYDDARAAHVVADSQQWLADLDADPTPLRDFLLRQADNHRLGHYFGALVEYWLRFSPAFGARAVTPRFEVSTSDDEPRVAVLKHVSCMDTKIFHVESAFQLTLGKSIEEVDIVASRFSGAFLHDSLCWRLLEARSKMEILHEAWPAKGLLSALSAAATSKADEKRMQLLAIESCLLLKGYIFLPHADFLARTTPPEQWRFVSRAALLGWWVFNIEDLIKPAPESRWLILAQKRYWLSPLLAHEDESGDVHTEGDTVLGLQPLHAVTGPNLAAAVAAWKKANNSKHPILVVELQQWQPTAAGQCMWMERSRGFILPPRWTTEFAATETAEPCEDADARLTDGPIVTVGSSVTRLQVAMEQRLRTGASLGVGLDEFWREVATLTTVAESTNRRSKEVQLQRQQEMRWRPGAPTSPLPPLLSDVVPALLARWPDKNSMARAAVEDELSDIRTALVHWLFQEEHPKTAVVAWLAELQVSVTHRNLCHVILDAYRYLAQRRSDVAQSALEGAALTRWQALMTAPDVHGGACCQKVVVKAAQTLGLELPALPRDLAWNEFLEACRLHGFPGRPSGDEQQRASALQGAAQLLRERLLNVAEADRLSKKEVTPVLVWLASFGEIAAGRALLSSTAGQDLIKEFVVMLADAGHGRMARRVFGDMATLPNEAVSGDCRNMQVLQAMPDLEVRWVTEHLDEVAREIFTLAQHQGGVIALDAEWRPVRSKQESPQVEIVQLSVASMCWILDVQHLLRTAPVELALFLGQLSNASVKLLG